MALLSNLLKGDAKLAACQINDAAHLTIGARGEHVAKVQFALFALDSSAIDRNEVRLQTYGPSTAKAVLAYKTKRKIINTAYQNTPDNIVGKMTITRLDLDMRFFEQTHRGFGECGPAPSVAGAPAVLAGLQPRSSGLVGGPGGRLTQLSKTLHIYCSITSKASSEGGFPLAKQIQKAKDVLSPHGLTLTLEFGGSSGFADTITFPYSLVLDDDVAQLRKASEATRAGSEKIVRIIACPRSVNAPMGETFRTVTVGGKLFPAFAVLNSNAVASDGATLIHEMIHAAHSGPVPHDGEANSVFFGEPKAGQGAVERTMLKSDRALTLSKAFFAT
ncbi:MAG: hypothetical protein WBD07_18320 [Vicinamibacterales bacterium]